jgi:hypothetical protein
MPMNKAKELERQIDALKEKLEGLSKIDCMTAAELSRSIGVSQPTARRIMDGSENTAIGLFKRALPFMDTCPCCGGVVKHELEREEDEE